MNHDMQCAKRFKWMGAGLAALALALAAPLATAGPEEDNLQAEQEFARGDLVASMALWRKAAEQGYAPAQIWLGDILDKSEEDEEAVSWYRKAAAQGSAGGEYGLGVMYSKGEGVEKDLAQAYAYIFKAAEKNYLQAMVAMMEAYRHGGLGLAVDPVQADAWEAKVIVLAPGYKKVPPPPAGKGKTKKGEKK